MGPRSVFLAFVFLPALEDWGLMTSPSILLPDELEVSESYVLGQEIPAPQLLATDNGGARWGPMIRLPRGAELHKLGPSFDDRTILVRFEHCFFVIFSQDLTESQRPVIKQGKQARTA
jgi:hypothetical protein